ncbi:2,4'-dihydroxyacetophenone dioxygenase family protein [uncultured Microbulbifer sp.]|uniref:2,4'-dihydroxyacetophenone dioxygenase family protein n=1 Tax=uncultured Microbulbifer sp. TaxID=348147 RepID=UPI0025ECD0EE|nr:2,4'-dihydroxyacetophenone dioxygenase family protein [uncultured Microbulbifer sp.]
MTIPFPIHSQDSLLTINTDEQPFVKNALPGVHVMPCFLDTENGVWVLRVQFEPGTVLPRHFHTGCVHLYTISGSWHYTEYPDQPQTAGSYLYEPGGSVHQFQVPETNTEITDTFMAVFGANINFDENDEFMNVMDAGWIETIMLEAAKAQGIVPRYIKPKSTAGYSDEA